MRVLSVLAAALLIGCSYTQPIYGDYCDANRACDNRPSVDFCDDAGHHCAAVCLVAGCDLTRRSCLYREQLGPCPPDGGAPDGR